MGEVERFDRTMSDAEGLMWRLEQDPFLSSTFANLTILDRRPDIDVLRTRLERALVVIPRLRQRVQSTPGNVTPPVWVDDPHLDIDFHLRHLALPKPGSMRQLLDLVALLVADPFDRARPLWQFIVIDGLRGGRAALLQKVHHTITDGEGGVRLSMQFLDLQRDAPPPPPLDPGVEERVLAADGAHHDPGDVWRAMVAGGLRLPLGLVRQLRDLLAEPGSLPSAGAAAAETVRGVLGQLTDLEPARSPLWTARSLRRRFDVLDAPLAATREAARRHGGTLNTAFVTIAADAAGAYHRLAGHPVDTLRASMAVSLRNGDASASGNAFSLARLTVPTGEMPIVDRFRLVQTATDQARTATSAGSLDAIAAVSSALPTALLTRIARQQAQTVDFATSNVRGAPFPLYLAGSLIEHNYPVGPLAGVAFNLTLLSYDDRLDMGVHQDAAAVSDPDLLRRCLERSTQAFVDA